MTTYPFLSYEFSAYNIFIRLTIFYTIKIKKILQIIKIISIVYFDLKVWDHKLNNSLYINLVFWFRCICVHLYLVRKGTRRMLEICKIRLMKEERGRCNSPSLGTSVTHVPLVQHFHSFKLVNKVLPSSFAQNNPLYEDTYKQWHLWGFVLQLLGSPTLHSTFFHTNWKKIKI